MHVKDPRGRGGSVCRANQYEATGELSGEKKRYCWSAWSEHNAFHVFPAGVDGWHSTLSFTGSKSRCGSTVETGDTVVVTTVKLAELCGMDAAGTLLRLNDPR